MNSDREAVCSKREVVELLVEKMMGATKRIQPVDLTPEGDWVDLTITVSIDYETVAELFGKEVANDVCGAHPETMPGEEHHD